jgi:Response regulator containing CheY-like receiver, AAA-type ATPase, and DNA-binding domains
VILAFVQGLQDYGKMALVPAATIPTLPAPCGAAAREGELMSKGTIFIMDDDLALQTVLEFALRRAGYDVVLAPDGQEGLRMLENLSPNLVISDIMMPNMDGVEVFQRLKERLQDDGIPIIIMTALNRKPWFADLEAEGAVILQKPFEVERLIELIDVSLT